MENVKQLHSNEDAFNSLVASMRQEIYNLITLRAMVLVLAAILFTVCPINFHFRALFSDLYV